VPEVAQGAAPELDELRAACRIAIGRVAGPGREPLVIGSGDRWRQHGATARGSLAGFGVSLEISLGSDEPGLVELPLSLTIGAWLLRETLGPACGATGLSAGEQGAASVPAVAPTTLLVMGDGSARRGASAPGYLDGRAAGFDARLVRALRSGTPEALLVDAELGDELLAAAPRAWSAARPLLAEVQYRAEVLYDAAPYGVGYFVATWIRDG
jgi:hypothetical protein